LPFPSDGKAGVGFILSPSTRKSSGDPDSECTWLMGDGESAEGSIWEAAQWAALQGLSNLCATIDINRLGQSEPTMLQHDLDTYQKRWEAFGWKALPVDGHDIPALLAAYEQA